jgi:hypothetical protein
MLMGRVRAHGGQGAVAGEIAAAPQINAVFRGTTRLIRVWQGFGDAEEFTVDEARALCVRGDQALLDGWTEFGRLQTGLWVGDEGAGELLVCDRQWLIAFLAAVRRALRTADTALAFGRRASVAIVDDASEPGSWDRHLRHTAGMRGATA